MHVTISMANSQETVDWLLLSSGKEQGRGAGETFTF